MRTFFLLNYLSRVADVIDIDQCLFARLADRLARLSKLQAAEEKFQGPKAESIRFY